MLFYTLFWFIYSTFDLEVDVKKKSVRDLKRFEIPEYTYQLLSSIWIYWKMFGAQMYASFIKIETQMICPATEFKWETSLCETKEISGYSFYI